MYSDILDSGPPAPVVARFLNTRAMKETFRSYMELLVSIALDPDTMLALEKSNGIVQPFTCFISLLFMILCSHATSCPGCLFIALV